jgi:molecular chaperone DnaK
VFTKLIERNTTIPTKKSQIFSTAEDNQTAVTVRVYQGEREMAHENRLLGEFNLEGIPPAPRGVPQIEVSFDIDANGIVHVSAKDLGTGKEQKIRIESSSGLSEDEINKMVKDAEQHADEDKKARERAEARNEADSLVYTTEKSLSDYGDKVSDSDRQAIQSAIDDLKKALEGDDLEDIKQKTEALKQASHTLAQTVYQQAQQEQGGGTAGAAGGAGAAGAGSNGNGQADYEDADYEVVNEEDQSKNR